MKDGGMPAPGASELTLKTALELGRVSNLPTVWSNALAAVVLANGADGVFSWGFIALLIALSLFYLGGMFLNDYFDAEIDARLGKDRPIPRGDVSKSAVMWLGGGMLAAGLLICSRFNMDAVGAGVALTAAILLYDITHKQTVFAPVFMGLCRGAVYLVAASAITETTRLPVFVGATGLFIYVIGLTYAAKQEDYNRLGSAWPLLVLLGPVMLGAMLITVSWWTLPYWLLLAGWMSACVFSLFRRLPGDVGRAVVGLIAGISLYDAMLMAAAGAPLMALLAVMCFGATLWLQRVASGT